MILPRNGRIVIIDDNMEDVKELMQVFSMDRISFSYFIGDIETLPQEPLSDTFLVLLDLELDGSAKGNDATQASQVISVLQRILGPSFSDFSVIIIAWSNALNILRELKPRMVMAQMNPLAFFEIDKPSCKETGHFKLDLIKAAVEAKMAELPSLDLLFFWDNLVGQATVDVYKNILPGNYLTTPADLNKRLNSYYEELAKAYIGKSVTPDHSHSTINILNALLSNEIGKFSCDTIKLELSQENKAPLMLSDYAHINSCINTVPQPHPLSCGSVHNNPFSNIKVTGFDIFQNKKEAKASDKKSYDKMQQIICEVSTLCDQAQGRKHFLRFAPGLLVPSTLGHHIKQNTEYLYKSCLLQSIDVFDGEPFHIVLDFRRFFTVEKFETEPQLLFQLSETLLMHIQNKLGRQISNPGVVFADHTHGT